MFLGLTLQIVFRVKVSYYFCLVLPSPPISLPGSELRPSPPHTSPVAHLQSSIGRCTHDSTSVSLSKDVLEAEVAGVFFRVLFEGPEDDRPIPRSTPRGPCPSRHGQEYLDLEVSGLCPRTGPEIPDLCRTPTQVSFVLTVSVEGRRP